MILLLEEGEEREPDGATDFEGETCWDLRWKEYYFGLDMDDKENGRKKFSDR